MIVVGVDPGARSTAIVVVDTTAPYVIGDGNRGRRALLHAVTIENPGALLPVPAEYLAAVVLAVLDAARGGRIVGDVYAPPADLVAVEEVTRPRQHLGGTVARGGKGGAAADPTALFGTCEVRGAVRGRAYGCPVVDVPPNRNGAGLPGQYPPSLLDRGGLVRPRGARRHERAAYDVALSGPARLALVRRGTS